MIIIVEGPDGAGKTTLVESLLRSIPGATMQHFGAPETPEAAEEYWQVYAAAIQKVQPNQVVIFDRSWYSDMVYGPVMRRRSEMSRAHADMLSAMVVASGGGMILYCTAPIKVLASRCRQRGESYVTAYADLQDITKLYSDVMQTQVSYLPVIRYDTAARW